MTATTFSIIAVFMPVAFMGGVAGEWFRPFALTVATSVLVSLFISFTLDPMLSAYWGDPVGLRATRAKRGIGTVLAALQRLVRPPGRPLRQRHRLGAAPPQVDGRRSPWLRFVGAIVLQVTVGGSSFLPEADGGMIAIDVRTPSSASLEYAQAQGREGRGAGAHACRRPRPPTATCNAGGGRVYVDIGKSDDARALGAARSPQDLRERLARLVGAEYVVLDDLNNGAQQAGADPVLRARTRAGCMAITNDFMEKMKQDPGRGGRGPVGAGPEGRAARSSSTAGSPTQLGISVGDAAQALRVAFAGVEVGDWVDPDRRDRATWRCACIRTTASTPPTSSTCRSRSAAAT